jgi:hypothetical protein
MKDDSNPIIRFTRLALALGRDTLPDDSHPKSPRTYTQPQLLACLLIRAYLKLSYRRTADLLGVSDGLRDALGLDAAELPDHSTLQKFAGRAVTDASIDDALAALLRRVAPGPDAAAIDSTGLETGSASARYVARSGRRRRHYVKLSVAVTCGGLLPLGVAVGRGPSNDAPDAWRVLAAARRKGLRPARLIADRGYDAEWIHRLCRRGWKVPSLIPVIHRRGSPLVRGRYRHACRAAHRNMHHGRRWHVETYMSALKRTTGSSLAARTSESLDREVLIRVLAYAVRR